MVAAIRHPQTALRIEHQRMRGAELAVAYADLPPRLDELAVRRELADARRGAALEPLGNRRCGGHSLAVVPVGHVDAAVGPHDDVVGLIELAIGVARLAGGAQTQQLLALRAELVNLVSLCAGRVGREVRDPDVPVLVDGDAVRGDHDALAEVGEHGAGLPVELEDRIDRGIVAVNGAAASRARAAAFVRPDVAVLRIDVDAGGRAPLPAGGQLSPVARDDGRRIRQPFARDRIGHDSALRVRGRSLSVCARTSVPRRHKDGGAQAKSRDDDS